MATLFSFPGWTRLIQTIKNINDSSDNIVKITEKTNSALTVVTKTMGVTAGSTEIAKSSADLIEALACKDGVCADSLSLFTSFIPGPNITSVITIFISVGCKVFVYCCKKSTLPWGGC